MKTNYKVGDKVTILPFEVGTVGRRVYYPEMLQNIGLVGTVTDVFASGVYVETSVASWCYDFKFIKPLEETSMTKPTAINVINQSPKVRAKLSKALVSLGYDLDCDYGEGSNGNSTRIYNDYRNYDLGSVSERSSVSTVDATDLKFKDVLKAVMPLLEAKYVFQPKFEVGDTVKVVAHDRTQLPMDKTYTVIEVEQESYTGDLPYRVKSDAKSDWVGHTALELVHEEPVELQQADFKFTRVKLKATGALGVVIGRVGNHSVCVQFDMSSAGLHSASSMSYQGADERCWYHSVEDLEIIGD